MTRRNAAMFGPPGRLYVYRSYGVHWCANVVCAEEGIGAAVLLRAPEPGSGIDQMRSGRRFDHPSLLAAGPGTPTAARGTLGGGTSGGGGLLRGWGRWFWP